MDPIDQLIQLALQEDLGPGDVTTDAIFGTQKLQGHATIIAKQDLVLSGLGVTERVFHAVDKTLQWSCTVSEGAHLKAGTTIAWVTGSVASLLKAERTALNFLQQLSGIATYTASFAQKLAGSGIKIRDTRKTIPGFRALAKQATRAGGAENHRMGLYDQFLVKDNHIMAAGSIKLCLERIRGQNPHHFKIQVEVTNEAQVAEAVQAGADSLLLDNMTPLAAKAIATRWRDQVELEVSGGVTLENIHTWRESGVHAISIGALTHSAPAVDIAMKFKA